jgi:two-component system alkaline phosphatase synthesis response regulator PhoP
MLKNMPKILVVDDELDILEIIRHALNKEGFEVHIAANGFQALEQTRKIKPDLILMDVMMPVMDGMEACRQLKEDDDTKYTHRFSYRQKRRICRTGGF